MKHISTILVTLCFLSCQSQSANNWENLSLDREGFYISEPGKFKAKFPEKPTHFEREVNAGTWKAVDHLFQYNENEYLMYSVSFMDFPESYLRKLNTELLLESTVDQMIATSNDSKIVKKEIRQHENGQEIYFELVSNDPSIGGFTYGRVILVENRLYKVIYGGTNLENPDSDQLAFITEFEVTEKK